MGKYSNINRLSKKEQDDLFILFVEIVGSLGSTVAAANFVKGLLTEQEVSIVARRLQIAQLLDEGLDYHTITKQVKISSATIAKVQLWMRSFPDGFSHALQHKKKPKANNPLESDWRRHKKKYPMYYWPQLLLEEIVKSATKRERARLHSIIGEIKEKTKLTRQLERLLKYQTKL